MSIEYVEDINGSDNMEPEWGPRFRGWYRTKTFLRHENLPLDGDVTYRFNICDYKFKFIQPPRIEFFKGFGEGGKLNYGIIEYSPAERTLGVFRYPLDSKGFFSNPLSVEATKKEISKKSIEEIKEIIKTRKVLTFEAFRIPFYGFEFLSISEDNFKEISTLTQHTISSLFRSSYEEELNKRINEVKDKILSAPNYPLILQNILDQKITDEKEILEMTSKIIHFGI